MALKKNTPVKRKDKEKTPSSAVYDALQLSLSFFHLALEEPIQYSLLDMMILLLIQKHPGCSQTEIEEWIYGTRGKRNSSLKRPIERLMLRDFVNVGYVPQEGRKGPPKTAYTVTRAGKAFLKKSQVA